MMRCKTNLEPVECAVSGLRDVIWSPEAFDALKIPTEKKRMLSSLAQARLGLIPTIPFDDLIDGKGKGLNILLKYVIKEIVSTQGAKLTF